MSLFILFVTLFHNITVTCAIHNWTLVSGFDPVVVEFDHVNNPVVQASITRGTKCEGGKCVLVKNVPKIIITNVNSKSFTLNLVNTTESSEDNATFNFLIAWVVVGSGYIEEHSDSYISYAGSITYNASSLVQHVELNNISLGLTNRSTAFSAQIISADSNDGVSTLAEINVSAQIEISPEGLNKICIWFHLTNLHLTHKHQPFKLHYLLINTYKLQGSRIKKDKADSTYSVKRIFTKNDSTMPFEWNGAEPLLLPLLPVPTIKSQPEPNKSPTQLQVIAKRNETRILSLHVTTYPALTPRELLFKDYYFLVLPMTKPPPLITLTEFPSGITYFQSTLVRNMYEDYYNYTWLSGITNKNCTSAHPVNPNSKVDCYNLCNFYLANPSYCQIDENTENYNKKLLRCLESNLAPSCEIRKHKPHTDAMRLQTHVVESALLSSVKPSDFACKGASPGKDYVVCRISQLKNDWPKPVHRTCNNSKNVNKKIASVALSDDPESATQYYISLDICENNIAEYIKCKEDSKNLCSKPPNLEFEPVKNQKLDSDYTLYVFCCSGSENRPEVVELDDYIEQPITPNILFVPIYGSELDPSPVDDTCIYSEWEDWSECQVPCKMPYQKALRARRRALLQGDSRKCQTTETGPCENSLPYCSEMCYTTQWSEWSRCPSDDKDIFSESTRAVLYDSDACNYVDLVKKTSCSEIYEEQQLQPQKAEAADMGDPLLSSGVDLIVHNRVPIEYSLNHNIASNLTRGWSGCTRPCDTGFDDGLSFNISLTEDETRPCLENFRKCSLAIKLDCQKMKYVGEHFSNQFCQMNCMSMLSNCKTDLIKCYALEQKKDDAFFENCKFPKDIERKAEAIRKSRNNTCFISKASYSTEDDSWVDKKTGSCHCYEIGAVPCDEQDIFTSVDTLADSLLQSGVCLPEAVPHTDVSFLDYVSFGGRMIAYCPIKYRDNDHVTFSRTSTKRLENFCKFGSGFYQHKNPKYTDLFKYQCLYAASNTPSVTNEICAEECRKLEEECKAEAEAINTCLIKNLTVTNSEFSKKFCHMSEVSQYDCNLAYSSRLVKDEIDICPIICNYYKNKCEIKLLNRGTQTPKTCLKKKILKSDFFQNNCKIQLKGKVPGNGLVFCKFKPVDCGYSEWSEWSECSEKCNRIDLVSTRSRKRRIIHPASNYGKTCNSDELLGTIDIEICKHLPPCNEGKWISTFNPVTKPVALDFIKKYDEPIDDLYWVKEAFQVYTKLERNSNYKECKLYKSEQVEWCGCPRGYSPCSLGESVKSKDLLKSIKNLCTSNPLAYISFEDDVDIYYYSCNIGMLFSEDEFDIGDIHCNANDNFQYSSCYKNSQNFETFNIFHFFSIGVILSLVYIVGGTISTRMSRIVKGKLKSD